MKRTHPFTQLLELVGISLVAEIILAIENASLTSQTSLTNETFTVLEILGSQLLCFALPVFILGLVHYHGTMRDTFRFHFAGRYWILGLGCVGVLFLLMPLLDWLSVWNHRLHFPASLAALEDMFRSITETSEGITNSLISNTPLPVSLLCIAIAPAICEELFFRAGIQNLLQQCIHNRHAVVWLTATIFSLAHFEPFDFLSRLLIGGLLGYAYLYGGSIVVNATIHFINNAMVVIMYYLFLNGNTMFDPKANLEASWLITLCCTLAAVGLFTFLFFFPKFKHTNKE